MLKQLRATIVSDYFRLFELALIGVLIYLIQQKWIVHEYIVDVVTVPLLAGILCEILHANHKLHEQDRVRKNQFDRLQANMQEIAGINASEMTRLMIIKELGRANAKVEASQIDAVWRRLTQSLSTNYFATNYIDYQHMYGNDGAKAIIAAQQAKMLNDEVKIEKVFITDNAAELHGAPAQATVKMHRDAGIPVRHINRSEIDTELGKKRAIADDHMDFAIFDDSVVLRWHFDAQRKIDGGELLFGENEIRPYIEFFKLLRDVAVPL